MKTKEILKEFSHVKNFQKLFVTSMDWHIKADKWSDKVTGDLEDQSVLIGCRDCSSGHCCNQPVVATFLDSFPIACVHHKAGLNDQKSRDLLRTTGELQETLMEKDDLGYNMPCPFFNSKKRLCLVYKVRPVICRVYWAIDDKEKCGHRNTNELVGVINYSPIVGALTRASMEIAEIMGYGKRNIFVRSLPLAVSVCLEALNDPDNFWDILIKKSVIPDDRLKNILMSQTGGDRELMEEVSQIFNDLEVVRAGE